MRSFGATNNAEEMWTWGTMLTERRGAIVSFVFPSLLPPSGDIPFGHHLFIISA